MKRKNCDMCEIGGYKTGLHNLLLRNKAGFKLCKRCAKKLENAPKVEIEKPTKVRTEIIEHNEPTNLPESP